MTLIVTAVVVVVVAVIGVVVTKREARRKEEARVAAERAEAEAIEVRRAGLWARIEQFQDAWSRSDLNAIGDLYPEGEQRRSDRLPERFAERGWSDPLPQLGTPIVDDRTNPNEVEAFFPVYAGEVRLVWNYAEPEWRLRFLKLPDPDEVAAADRRVGRTRSENPPGGEAPIAIAHLTIDSPKDLARFSYGTVVRAVLSRLARTMAEQETEADPFEELAATTRWPLAFDVHLVGGAIVVGVSTANDGPFLMQALSKALAFREREFPQKSVGSEDFLYRRFLASHFYEGRHGERDHLAVVVNASSERQARAALLATISSPTVAPPDGDAWARTEGASTRGFLAWSAILDLLPEEERALALPMIKTVLGDFSWVVMSGREHEGRYQFDYWADLDEQSGLVGSILAPLHDGDGVLGWVPEGIEFMRLAVNPEPVTAALQWARALIQTTESDPEVMELLEALDLAEVLRDLDGRLVLMSPASTVERALDVDASLPAVLAIRVTRPSGMIEHWLSMAGIPPEAIPRLERKDDIGDDVLVLDLDGDPLYVTERDGVVIAGLGAGSEGIMMRCLETGGNAPLPAEYRSRLGSIPEDAAWVGLGSILSDVEGRLFMRSLEGPQDPLWSGVVEEYLREVDDKGGGVNASWVVVNAEGLHARVVY